MCYTNTDFSMQSVQKCRRMKATTQARGGGKNGSCILVTVVILEAVNLALSAGGSLFVFPYFVDQIGITLK